MNTSQSSRLQNRDIFTVAFPIILSNVTTPLLGIVDTAVLGQLDAPHLIGAAAVGASIFSMLFWAFGFLRMGTTGLTAQADGANNASVVAETLLRALFIGLSIGGVLILSQGLLSLIAFTLYPASQNVEEAAQIYFDIRILSAPATLANYALLGWFIGLGRAYVGLILQLLLNGTNILLSIYFVMELNMGVAGVAYASLIAEVIATFVGLALAFYYMGWISADFIRRSLTNIAALKETISVNTDIMIRTLCLIFAFTFMTAQSASMDDVTLAANAVLLGFLNISSYFLDGFAFATERFVGRAIGSKKHEDFRAAIYLSSVWALFFSLALCLVFWFFGPYMINMMTVNSEVRETARAYLFWAAIAPVLAVACFQLDGIFIGATQTKDMRNMMIVSLALYLCSWFLLFPFFNNTGLWAALMLFFIFRAATLGWRLPCLERQKFRAIRL